jgi:hypothetical protein
MDAITLSDALSCLALAIALAACAGIRAWLPLLLAGCLFRAGLLKLGDSFAFLGSNKALCLLAAATVIEILGAAVGAPTALVPHAAKSVLRAASTALTAGIANPFLSLLEDFLTVALFVLAVLVPVLVAAAIAMLAVLVLRRLQRRQQAVVRTA